MDIYKNLNLSSFPEKLKVKTILSAIIEIKYKSNGPVDLVIDKLFYRTDMIRQDYKKIEKNPEADIPSNIRSNIPNLQNTILYTSTKRDFCFRVGFGDNICSLSNLNFTYVSWNLFFKEFLMFFENLKDYIDSIEYIKVRYINVFKDNIIKNLKIDMKVLDKDISENSLSLLFEDKKDNFSIVNKISNNISYNYFNIEEQKSKMEQKQSVFDIEILKKIEDKNTVKDEITQAHLVLKQIFFETLKESFLNDITL